MKKLSCLFICLFLSFYIFAGEYASNKLGQKLGFSTTTTQWILNEESDSSSFLYHEGVLEWEKTTTETDGKRVFTYFYPSENKIEEFTYNGNLLERIYTSDSNQVSETVFNYTNGILNFCSYSVNNEPVEAEYYYRSLADNSLVSVKRFEMSNLLGTSYVYENENLLRQMHDGFVLEGEFYIDDSNNIIVEKDGTTLTYDFRGFLLNTKNVNEETEYYYEDGILYRSYTTQGNINIEKNYISGKLSIETIFVDSIVSESIDYNNSGKIRTMFNKGKPVADIYYEYDNRTIKRIMYF